MLRRLVILVLCLVAVIAPAAQAQNFLLPPARYDHPYVGGTTYYFLPKDQMSERCDRLAGRKLPFRPAECAKVRWVLDGRILPFGQPPAGARQRCIVFIAAHYHATEFEEVLKKHARAHCNGWWHLFRKEHAQ